jgi:1,4-alpha-glucan branching enzyme
VLAWLRRARDGDFVVCICNFTPLVRKAYRVGVPQAGRYATLINTDDEKYAGSGAWPAGMIEAQDTGAHGRPHSLQIDLPPLATLMLHAETATG